MAREDLITLVFELSATNLWGQKPDPWSKLAKLKSIYKISSKKFVFKDPKIKGSILVPAPYPKANSTLFHGK